MASRSLSTLRALALQAAPLLACSASMHRWRGIDAVMQSMRLDHAFAHRRGHGAGARGKRLRQVVDSGKNRD